MVANLIVQEYITSFVLGLSLSVGIVLLTPKQKLITFDEDTDESISDPNVSNQQIEKQEHTDNLDANHTMPTDGGDSDVVNTSSPDAAGASAEEEEEEDVSQYVDNPELPKRLNKRRTKKPPAPIAPPISADIASAMGKKPKLKKFFGISDETIADAINQQSSPSSESPPHQNLQSTVSIVQSLQDENKPKPPTMSPEARATMNEAKDEIRKLIDSQEQLSSFETGFFSAVMFLITLFGILAALLLINIATSGDFGRIIVGMFPRETEALKIKEFLINFHN